MCLLYYTRDWQKKSVQFNSDCTLIAYFAVFWLWFKVSCAEEKDCQHSRTYMSTDYRTDIRHDNFLALTLDCLLSSSAPSGLSAWATITTLSLRFSASLSRCFTRAGTTLLLPLIFATLIRWPSSSTLRSGLICKALPNVAETAEILPPLLSWSRSSTTNQWHTFIRVSSMYSFSSSIVAPSLYFLPAR